MLIAAGEPPLAGPDGAPGRDGRGARDRVDKGKGAPSHRRAAAGAGAGTGTRLDVLRPVARRPCCRAQGGGPVRELCPPATRGEPRATGHGPRAISHHLKPPATSHQPVRSSRLAAELDSMFCATQPFSRASSCWVALACTRGSHRLPSPCTAAHCLTHVRRRRRNGAFSQAICVVAA